MCYKAPGPRCSSHAKATLQRAQNALDKIAEKIAPGDSTDKYEAARDKVSEAHSVWIRTPEGIRHLRDHGDHELADFYAAERRALINSLPASVREQRDADSGEHDTEETPPSPLRTSPYAGMLLSDSQISQIVDSQPEQVDYDLVMRKNLSEDTLDKMAFNCPQVGAYITYNPNASGIALDSIARRISKRGLNASDDSTISMDDRTTLYNIATHRNTGRSTLENLYGSTHPQVRAAVARNPNTPDHYRSALASDSDADVRAAAREASR